MVTNAAVEHDVVLVLTDVQLSSCRRWDFLLCTKKLLAQILIKVNAFFKSQKKKNLRVPSLKADFLASFMHVLVFQLIKARATSYKADKA